jgi:hypothetical protein
MLIHNKRLDHVHHKTFVMMKRNYVKKKKNTPKTKHQKFSKQKSRCAHEDC